MRAFLPDWLSLKLSFRLDYTVKILPTIEFFFWRLIWLLSTSSGTGKLKSPVNLINYCHWLTLVAVLGNNLISGLIISVTDLIFRSLTLSSGHWPYRPVTGLVAHDYQLSWASLVILCICSVEYRYLTKDISLHRLFLPATGLLLITVSCLSLLSFLSLFSSCL